jgi:hypothetical protein
MAATTRGFDPTALENTLCVSFELGEGTWKLSFTSGFGEQVFRGSVRSRDQQAMVRQLESMKKRLGLAADCRVVSCYEAGRDGFWLHRFLEAQGVENLVVDSSSIEVSRRKRRASGELRWPQRLVLPPTRSAPGRSCSALDCGRQTPALCAILRPAWLSPVSVHWPPGVGTGQAQPSSSAPAASGMMGGYLALPACGSGADFPGARPRC